MTKHFITTLFLIFIVKFSLAQTGETELYNQLKKAEKELNGVNYKLKKQTNQKDKNAIIKEQNDWLKSRDLTCKKQFDPDNNGGVIENKLRLSCLIEMTEQRIIELKSLLKKKD